MEETGVIVTFESGRASLYTTEGCYWSEGKYYESVEEVEQMYPEVRFIGIIDPTEGEKYYPAHLAKIAINKHFQKEIIR